MSSMSIEAFLDRHMNVVSRAGDEVLVFCVFHEDGTKPSMYVNVVKNVFMCQACGAKGSTKRLEKLFGSGLISSTMPLDKIRDRIRAATTYSPEETRTYPDEWLEQFNNPHDYWTDKRGLSPSVIRRFDLGYDPFNDAVTIPLRDSHGKVLGIIRRNLDPNWTPRYLYPKGFKRAQFLFGAGMVRTSPSTTVAVVEGSVDAISMWDAKVPAVAILGSNMSEQQASILRRVGATTAVLVLDNDGAGRRAVPEVTAVLQDAGIRTRVAKYPSSNAKDPNDLSRAQRRAMFQPLTSRGTVAKARRASPRSV